MPRILKDDHFGRMMQIALSGSALGNTSGYARERMAHDLRQLNPDQLAELIAVCDERLAGIRALRRQLVESAAAPNSSRKCEWCRKPLVGRADQRFCSGDCRLKAHRRRQPDA